MKNSIRRALALAAICAVAMALPASSALAQSATEQGYDESGVLGQVGEPGDEGSAGVSPSTTTDNGSLPFTGFDVGVIALMGGTLVLTGLALRRGRRPSTG